MVVLAVILARAGSKGLPGKCVRTLRGRPVIEFTFDHAKASRLLTAVVLTTDSEPAKALAHRAGIEVVDRPTELATDTATVDAAARHAVLGWESRHHRTVDAIALLYGNIPVRADGLIDRAIRLLKETEADSVRSVAPVSKQHPDWIHRLHGDRMIQFRPNSIYRRQDLEPLFYHDGAIAVVTRDALFAALKTPDDHQAFLGRDRRALIQQPEDAVDIDGPVDLMLAEGMLRNHADHGEPQLAVVPPAFGSRTAFVVAEAGVNHNGDLATALELVDAAADCGADAVKFQMFRAAELVTVDAPAAGYQSRRACGPTQLDMLARLELTQDEFLTVRAHCRKRAIRFMATPFSPHDVHRLLELDPIAIKIASPDLTNRPLLAAAARTTLPLIVSTGAATEEEIGVCVAELTEVAAARRLILLHCISCYPTPVEALNLNAINTLRKAFGVPCGLSDHTMSTLTGSWAVVAGACILEKHLTLDTTASGPDHAMSLIPAQFAEYVTQVRAVEKALGNGRLGFDELQADVRRVARRSIVAVRPLPAGTTLTADMLTLKRPGSGLPPGRLDDVIGRRTRVAIPSDAMVSMDMLE